MPYNKKEDKKGLAPTKLILDKFVLKSKKFTDEEQQLRDLWNKQYLDNPVDTEYGVTLPPQSPPMFQPDSPIVGSGLAQMAEKFFKIAPNLRNKASRIQYGPGGPAGDVLQDSGLSPYRFDISNLLGATSIKDQEINLNPSLGKSEFYDQYTPEQVLGHELTHAAGHHEKTAREAEELIKKMKWSSNK